MNETALSAELARLREGITILRNAHQHVHGVDSVTADELTRLLAGGHTTGLRVPTIHLNGTDRAGLLEQASNVCAALRQVSEAIAHAAPHGRDYYPQGPDAIGDAVAKYVLSNNHLRQLEADWTALYEAIYDAPVNR